MEYTKSDSGNRIRDGDMEADPISGDAAEFTMSYIAPCSDAGMPERTAELPRSALEILCSQPS